MSKNLATIKYSMYDEEGDATMMPVPLFQPISAPRIISMARKDLVEWKQRRQRYLSIIEQHNAGPAVTVKNSFNEDVLESVCKWILDKEVKDVTDKLLSEWIDKQIHTGAVQGNAASIESVYRDMAMDLEDPDPLSRCLNLFQDMDTRSKLNGLDEYFKNNPKDKVKRLVKAIRPGELRTRIQQVLDYENNAAKEDPKQLWKIVYEKTTMFNEVYLSQQAHRNAILGDNKRSDRKTTSKTSNGQNKPAKIQTHKLRETNKTFQITNTEVREKPRFIKDGCWHCGQDHHLNECNISDEEKAAVAAKRIEQYKNRKASKRIAKTNNNEDKVWNVTFALPSGKVITIPATADSGADETMIPSELISELQRGGISCDVFDVSPEEFTLGNDANTTKFITKKAILKLRLTTPVGAVNFPEETCCITEGANWEILLGSPLLQKVGINVKDQLEELAKAQNENDVIDGELYDEGMLMIQDIDLNKQLYSLTERALHNGVPAQYKDRILLLLDKYKLEFESEIKKGAPANVPEMKLEPREGAQPLKCNPRRYSPKMSQVMAQHVEQLLSAGFIRKNSNARWCSPCFPVRKPGCDQWRMTIDYSKVNARLKPLAGAMPCIPSSTFVLRSMKSFAKMDLFKGFWQMPLDPEAQEILSFMTDKGIYSPNRVTQGTSDSALYFQGVIAECFKDMLGKSVLIWIDDILLFAKDDEELFAVIEQALKILHRYNLKANADKCELFLREVIWCGRVYNGDGIRPDPNRIQGLVDLRIPTNLGELQQLMCAAGWMRNSLPDFARITMPLQSKLNDGLKGTTRTARVAKRISVTFDNEEIMAFNDLKRLLKDSVKLSYPSDDAEICVFTDASSQGWGIAITQVINWNEELPICKQQHQALLFLSGTFNNTQQNWSVIEREGYPIILATKKADYLLRRDKPFRLFCDHKNLVTIFAPGNETKKHVSSKLHRWSLQLLSFSYEITHIDGTENIWADLLSRWIDHNVLKRGIRSVRRHHTYRMDDFDYIHTLAADNFEMPRTEDICAVQAQYENELPDGAIQNELGIYTIDDLVWIPPRDVDLTTRLLIIGHCGPQGHRGCQVLANLLGRRFKIHRLMEKCTDFTTGCLLCLHTKGGHTIPRPWSDKDPLAKRNEKIHWDYLYIGDSEDGVRYILVMKDEASHFCMLETCIDPTAETTAQGLLRWASLFGYPKIWISDTATHFKNQVINELTHLTGSEQDFVLAYCPWRNGTIERVNHDILQVIRVIILELRIPQNQWPKLISAIQLNLNCTPVPSLDGHAPIEVFTGLPLHSALDAIVMSDSKPTPVNITSPNISPKLELLRNHLAVIHQSISDIKERQQLKQRLKHAGKCIEANFMLGDYVLWSKVDRQLPKNKLQVVWLGPYVVTRCGPYSCQIQHLLTKQEHEAHHSRLKFYRDSSLNVTDTLLAHISNQATILAVKKLKGHRKNQHGSWEVLVSWRGLEDIDDSFEPLENLAFDIPVMLKAYLSDVPEPELRAYGERLGGRCGVAYPMDTTVYQ